MKDFFVYMLLCENESIYTGYTVNLKMRIRKHFIGNGGAKYTRAFRPIKVLCAWQILSNKGDAMKVESFIKSLSVTEKRCLAVSPGNLKFLIRCSGKEKLFDIKVDSVVIDNIMVE